MSDVEFEIAPQSNMYYVYVEVEYEDETADSVSLHVSSSQDLSFGDVQACIEGNTSEFFESNCNSSPVAKATVTSMELVLSDLGLYSVYKPQ